MNLLEMLKQQNQRRKLEEEKKAQEEATRQQEMNSSGGMFSDIGGQKKRLLERQALIRNADMESAISDPKNSVPEGMGPMAPSIYGAFLDEQSTNKDMEGPRARAASSLASQKPRLTPESTSIQTKAAKPTPTNTSVDAKPEVGIPKQEDIESLLDRYKTLKGEETSQLEGLQTKQLWGNVAMGVGKGLAQMATAGASARGWKGDVGAGFDEGSKLIDRFTDQKSQAIKGKTKDLLEEETLRRDDRMNSPNSDLAKQMGTLSKSALLQKAKEAELAGDKEGAAQLRASIGSVDGMSATEQQELLKMANSSDYKSILSYNLEREKNAIERQKANRVGDGKQPSSTQFQAAGFGRRIEQSLKDFEDIKAGGYDRTDVSSGVGKYMPNATRSDNALRQEQAERNFINAVLRRESGATISDEEFANAEKQYLPRVGDGPETLAQKARNRQQVLESLRAEAGSAWDSTPSVGGGGSSFPRQVRNMKTGQVATVSSQAELEEAKQMGFQ